MIIFVDIDETICESPESREYSEAKPIQENIKKINDIFDGVYIGPQEGQERASTGEKQQRNSLKSGE